MLPEDFILFIGALAPNKGVDILIEAYRKIETETELLLIGAKRPDYSYESTKNITVIEDASQQIVTEAYSRCKFVVIPSIWPERFGVVALEAMSLVTQDSLGLYQERQKQASEARARTGPSTTTAHTAKAPSSYRNSHWAR
jgi:glycosyltransferase involved in cell wall biosynthesis